MGTVIHNRQCRICGRTFASRSIDGFPDHCVNCWTDEPPTAQEVDAIKTSIINKLWEYAKDPKNPEDEVVGISKAIQLIKTM